MQLPAAGNDALIVGELNVTTPVGAVGVPPSASETTAVHVVLADTATDPGRQVTLVVVLRAAALTAAWVRSSEPPKSWTVMFAV